MIRNYMSSAFLRDNFIMGKNNLIEHKNTESEEFYESAFLHPFNNNFINNNN